MGVLLYRYQLIKFFSRARDVHHNILILVKCDQHCKLIINFGSAPKNPRLPRKYILAGTLLVGFYNKLTINILWFWLSVGAGDGGGGSINVHVWIDRYDLNLWIDRYNHSCGCADKSICIICVDRKISAVWNERCMYETQTTKLFDYLSMIYAWSSAD